MKRNWTRAVLAAALLAAPSIAQAHPGLHMHGFEAGFVHPLTGLDHLLAMVAVGFWAAALGGAARWIVPGAFVAVMALGGFFGAAGLQLPAVEYVIAASVVALGLLVAFEIRVPTVAAAALVALFAAFHGLAHGVEAPADASFVAFGLGFMIVTALLHGVGLGLGALRFGGAFGRLAGAAVALAGVYLVAAI